MLVCPSHKATVLVNDFECSTQIK